MNVTTSGASRKGKVPTKRASGGLPSTLRGSLSFLRRISPLRAFLAGNACLLLVMYCLWPRWREAPRGIVGDGHFKLRLGGGRRQLKTGSPPVFEYHGPLDVDDLALERALQIREDWLKIPRAERNHADQPGFVLGFLTPDPPYPFQRMQHPDNRDTGVVLVIAPFYDANYFRAEAARALFWRLKANGLIVVGISSYQEFPGQIVNPWDDRHTTPQDAAVYRAMDGWLHCFRDPDSVLPPGVPRILLSESDFHNPMRRDGGGSLIPWGLEKKWDIIYSNHGGDWNDFARNWTLAKAAFINLITQRNLKILITGKETVPDEELQPYIQSGSIELHLNHVEWRDFLKLIEQSRALIAPNVHDASPRVLVEALCVNTSILVNQHIVGGWKYVTQETGEFFSSADDIVEAWDRLVAPTRKPALRPRDWYMENWGVKRSALLLQGFLEVVVGKERLAKAQAIADQFINPH
eukprot:jgi/Botrbrau1/3010/Bobra.0070s0008.1